MTTHASKACCEIPPVVSSGYTAKGTHQKINNTDCYITGPTEAKKAIYFLYDVFGFAEQTLQGADILASAGYLVVMPDLFEGKPLQMEWFARDTEEKKQKITAFMGRLSDPQPHIHILLNILAGTKTQFPAVEKWASIGYCWGGKLVSLTSASNTPWCVGIQSSPAKLDAADAAQVTIPMAVLASSGEPAEAVREFSEALTTDKLIETFDSQIHGWMSARADLTDEGVRREYERGYRVALGFVARYM